MKSPGAPAAAANSAKLVALRLMQVELAASNVARGPADELAVAVGESGGAVGPKLDEVPAMLIAAIETARLGQHVLAVGVWGGLSTPGADGDAAADSGELRGGAAPHLHHKRR